MDNQRYPSKFGTRRAPPPLSVSPALEPLTDERLGELRELSSMHAELLPEFEPFLKELYRLGLIDGRRALLNVQRVDSDVDPASASEKDRT